jgi:hypothetical protein
MEEDIDDYKWNGLTIEGPPFRQEKSMTTNVAGIILFILAITFGKMADIVSSTNSEMADSPTSGFVGIWNVRHPSTLV